MICPICKNEKLKKAVFFGDEVEYCQKCLGVWLEEDELRKAKDDFDKSLNWLDVDLWQDKKNFKLTASPKICPKCEVPMYSVSYNGSVIDVDVCNLCFGVWLDRGEFKQITKYLKEKGTKEIIENYWKTLAKEGIELFTGPEDFKEEVSDFWSVLKLINYKLLANETIRNLIVSLPK